MKTTSLALAAILASASVPAAAAEPGNPFSISGQAGIVSDYRFRGISQSDRRFAVQAGLRVDHESGLYGGIWGSSIDDYVANGADAEIDLTLGYSAALGATTLDVGVLYYYFPGSGGVASDFVESYASLSHGFGPVAAKVSAAYAPKQSALSIGAGKEDNLYLSGDLSYSVEGTGLAFNAHAGHSFGPSYLTIGRNYADWSIGATYSTGPLTFGVAYVDTDGALITPSGRNAAKAGLVATLGASF